MQRSDRFNEYDDDLPRRRPGKNTDANLLLLALAIALVMLVVVGGGVALWFFFADSHKPELAADIKPAPKQEAPPPEETPEDALFLGQLRLFEELLGELERQATAPDPEPFRLKVAGIDRQLEAMEVDFRRLPFDLLQMGQAKHGERLRAAEERIRAARILAKAIPLQLDKGSVAVEGQLRHEDLDFDGKRNYRAYRLDLKEKRTYVIDLCRLQAGPFDPHLRVETMNLEVLSEDAGGGGNVNCRITFTPPQTAQYRLVVSRSSRSWGNFSLSIRESQLPALAVNNLFPQPVSRGEKLPVSRPVQDEPLKGNQRVPASVTFCQTGRLCGDLIWHIEGKSFFALSADGNLRRIALPDFGVEKRLETKRLCKGLALCKEGLILSTDELGELWIIDPESLEVRRIVKAAAPAHVVASPASSLVLATNDTTGYLDVVNLADGQAKTIGKVLSQLVLPRWTADGQFLFCEEKGGIVRYRVKGDQFVREESTKTLWSFLPDRDRRTSRIFVSPDNRWVCMPVHNKKEVYTPDPKKYRSVIYVFKVGDFSKPETILPVDSKLGGPECVSFLPETQDIFTHDNRGVLTAGFDVFRVNQLNICPAQMLILPGGNQVLCNHVFSGTVCLVELARSVGESATEQPITRATKAMGPATLHELNVRNVAAHEFSLDGAYLFVAEQTRLLRRIRVKDRIEERRVLQSAVPTSMAMTSEGLVCHCGQFIALVDPQTLKEIRRFPVLPTGALIPVPGEPLVMNVGAKLTLLNVKTGAVGPPLEVEQLLEVQTGLPAPDFVQFRRQAISADGRSLYLVSQDGKISPDGKGFRKLQRFQRKGLQWQPGVSAKFPTFYAHLPAVSPDGKWVTIHPVRMGQNGIDQGIAICHADTLKTAGSISIPSGTHVLHLTFSPTGQIVTHGSVQKKSELCFYSPEGKRLRAFPVESMSISSSLQRIDGKSLTFVRSLKEAFLMEFPE